MPSSPAFPSTLAGLVAADLLDAPTAALTSILLEHGVPMLVAGREPPVVDALLDGVVATLPPDRRPDPAGGVRSDRLVRVAGRLELGTPPGILRTALAATSGRSGLAVAVAADDLAGVLAVLRRQGLADDEVSFMGVVLVVGRPDGGEAADAEAPGGGEAADAEAPGGGEAADAEAPGGGEHGGAPARLVAAHYLRPVVRDAGGHTRRLGPAVLATWNPVVEGWDDFAWGIMPDLAERIRERAGDLAAECDRRAAVIAGHAHDGHAHDGHAHDGHAGEGPVG